MIPTDAQGTIEKFMRDFGETREQAIARWEAIMRTTYPKEWKVFVRDIIKRGGRK